MELFHGQRFCCGQSHPFPERRRYHCVTQTGECSCDVLCLVFLSVVRKYSVYHSCGGWTYASWGISLGIRAYHPSGRCISDYYRSDARSYLLGSCVLQQPQLRRKAGRDREREHGIRG
jgi:hypothetical protein